MERKLERDSSGDSKTGVIPFAVVRQYSGLEVLQQVKDGRLPMAPISDVIPIDLRDLEFGRATIVSTPNEKFYNTMGIVHGGYAMTLLDTCMGLAIYTTLSVKPIKAETGPLRAVGHAVHTGTRTATAEGRLIDEEGRLYAHGTTTCFLFPVDDAPAPLMRS
jgi:uncharacterized protein (TIGR00369 family)